MRRAVVALLLLAGIVGAGMVGAGMIPASAHSCAQPAVIPVGQPATVNVSVGAEAKAVVAVTITIPDGFEATAVAPPAGWRELPRRGADIVLEGGPIAQFGCATFPVTGQAARPATLAFVITTKASDGTVERLDRTEPGSARPAQMVFAGADQATATIASGGTGKMTASSTDTSGVASGEEPEDGGSGSTLALTLVAGAAVAAGLAAIVFLRRRRGAQAGRR